MGVHKRYKDHWGQDFKFQGVSKSITSAVDKTLRIMTMRNDVTSYLYDGNFLYMYGAVAAIL